ncbi:23799_t:CDS:2 [Racocetra persica]|uniref:23799_t:CDS:1 n=1 Tax=Racocetra persica TaxID=160502 RepID=A0ACA9KAE0_9GLOM|nr:23799_t:CDS:2 [Racocetra persica]
MYEDMNALYSGAMTQYMPTEIIGKVGSEEVPDIQTISPNAEIGYMPKVDLELSPYNAKLVQDKEVGAIYETKAKGHKDL